MSELMGDGVSEARPADADLVRSVFRAVPDAVLVVDPDGVVRMANDAAEELFSGVLIGISVEELMPAGARKGHAISRRHYSTEPRIRRMSDSPDIRGLRLDGKDFAAEISLSPVKVGDETWTVCAVRDVTEQRELQQKLRDMSLKDSLTGLHNRRYLDLQLSQIEKGRRTVGAVVVDLDELKTVNDTFGHGVGDQLIAAMAKHLRAVFRGDDVVCRIGGDEFAALLPGISEHEFSTIKQRLQKLSGKGANSAQMLRFSFGTAWCELPAKVRASLAEADAAMYRNKRARRWEARSTSLTPAIGEKNDDSD